jgi:hypothetical protein
VEDSNHQTPPTEEESLILTNFEYAVGVLKTLATKHTTSHAWFDAVKHLADSNNWYDVYILVCDESVNNKDYLLYIDFKKIDITGLFAEAVNVQFVTWVSELLATLLKRDAVFRKDALPDPFDLLCTALSIGVTIGGVLSVIYYSL